jgi:hypothetical protein
MRINTCIRNPFAQKLWEDLTEPDAAILTGMHHNVRRVLTTSKNFFLYDSVHL